jgi:long-chain acyl-CoA synthetase
VTLKELLAQSVQQRGDGVALRYKQQELWHTVSYNELLSLVRHVAEILSRHNIKPGDRVAIFSENAPEWPEIYFGIVGMGATAVPVDSKLQEQEVAHILRDSGAKLLFTNAKCYPLLRDIESHVPELHTVLLMAGREILPVRGRRIKYLGYEQLMEDVAGAAGSPARAYDKHHPKDDDIASFIYTSGTTGRQKGAMLTHRNFTANVEAVQKMIGIYPSDNFLLVLPLHHSLAFTANLILPIAVGSEISFVENLKTVGENMREVSPSVLIGVPLLLEKMYNRIWNGLKENKVGYTLFKLGIRKPVIRGIAQKLGGKLRLVVTGGAPCDPELLEHYGRLGIPFIEGYGLTETAPVLSLNPIDKPKPGTVGKPLPGVEISILDPDSEGAGEIAAKGPNIMKGYFNNPDATESVFRNGWFLTGDLGVIDAEGYVTITGRKKSLIVNREGKNIHPEEIEHQVCKSPYIREAIALGYREADEKVGEHAGVIVVPDQDALDALAQREKKTLSEGEIGNLIRTEVKKYSAEIAEYKRPRRIQIRWEDLDKTSTGKVKRYLYSMGAEDVGWTRHG